MIELMFGEKLKNKIMQLPDAAGVYIFKGTQGKIIYIGKAKSIYKRVGSYFNGKLDAKTLALVSNIEDLEFRLTPTESLALILEARLIHRYKPKYNISLRDDKSFPFVKITNEEFPAICVTRKREPDGSRYIGPFTSAKLLRDALGVIRRILPYRSCGRMVEDACMYKAIGLCPAPCTESIRKAVYARTISNIIMILEARTDALIAKLTRQMRGKAREHKYEQAAKLRDSIEALGKIGSAHAGGGGGLRDVDDLRSILGLAKRPLRIEAFDVSNISGQEACGSMVSFYCGKSDKNNYRRFRIKTVRGPDDYKMLSEVVSRRYARLSRERLALPDLILIDGGRGQLLATAAQLEKLGLDIPLVSIAKREENIYVRGALLPLRLKEGTAALNLIRRVRDEAHRFAVSYHRILRQKKMIGS